MTEGEREERREEKKEGEKEDSWLDGSLLHSPLGSPLAKISHQRGPPLLVGGTGAFALLSHSVIGWERGSGANMMIEFRAQYLVPTSCRQRSELCFLTASTLGLSGKEVWTTGEDHEKACGIWA